MAYTPTNIGDPRTIEELRNYLQRELVALAKELSETNALELRPVYYAPDKPREGMIVCADGTEWNPGSGAGAYEYKGGVWTKL